MTEELKACPFCGKEGWLFEHSSPYTTEYSVSCEDGCCEVGDEYEEQAIAAWNTRTPATQSVSPDVTEALVAHMAQRFLAWRLPAEFSPDNGISFIRNQVHHQRPGEGAWPVGTNLLSAVQAAEMVRHMLDGAPAMHAASQPSPQVEGLVEALTWYAEQTEGCRKLGSDGDKARQALDADGGRRARAALKAAQTDGGGR